MDDLSPSPFLPTVFPLKHHVWVMQTQQPHTMQLNLEHLLLVFYQLVGDISSRNTLKTFFCSFWFTNSVLQLFWLGKGLSPATDCGNLAGQCLAQWQLGLAYCFALSCQNYQKLYLKVSLSEGLTNLNINENLNNASSMMVMIQDHHGMYL